MAQLEDARAEDVAFLVLEARIRPADYYALTITERNAIVRRLNRRR